MQVPFKTFLVVFTTLQAANVLSTAIGWNYSSDVRGWWPLGLGLAFCLDAIAGATFVALTRRAPYSPKGAFVYSLVFAAVLVSYSLLFYVPSNDWPLGLQLFKASMRSSPSLKFYMLYVMFILSAAASTGIRARRRS